MANYGAPGQSWSGLMGAVGQYGPTQRSNVADKYWGRPDPNAGALGATLHITRVIPYSFWGVKLHAVGICATAQINCLANLAVSTGVGDGYTPTGSWNNFLFSATAAFTTAAATANGGTAATVVQSNTASDLLVVPSVARTDGGSGYVVMYRQYVPAAGNTEFSRVTIAGSTTLPITTTGVKSYYKTGSDSVTTPANFTSPIEWENAPAVYLEFFTGDAPKMLLVAGDSVTQGNDSSWGQNGAGRIAVDAMNAQSVTWAYINQGFTSQTSEAFFSNGSNMITTHRPTIAAFSPWSANDSDKYTTAGVQRQMLLAARWVALCQQYNCIPVLITPSPVNGATVAEETVRRSAVTLIKAMCASGVAVLHDRDAIYTNYSTASGGFYPGLYATSLHPNLVGYTKEAEAWQALLSKV